MTGEEIIERARVHFGEVDELTVTDETFQGWVNDALQELYTQLYISVPSSELRPLVREESLSFSSGAADVPEDWNRVVAVRSGGVDLHEVAPEVIAHIDTNRFFEPTQPVWATRDNTVWVRPQRGSATVAYLAPPDVVTDFGAEIGAFSPKWHPALVWLVTSYAYAQEEDLAQADHYRGRYLRAVRQPEPEQPSAPENQP